MQPCAPARPCSSGLILYEIHMLYPSTIGIVPYGNQVCSVCEVDNGGAFF